MRRLILLLLFSVFPISCGHSIASATTTNLFVWDMESLTSSSLGTATCQANSSISSEDAHTGTNSLKITAAGNDSGNEQAGCWFASEVEIGSMISGNNLYYRAWMKFSSGFSWGTGTAKMKASRIKDAAEVISPMLTGYMADDRFSISECPECSPYNPTAPSEIRVDYDVAGEAGSGWHEYIFRIKLQSGTSTCDGEFEVYRDGVSLGDVTAICYVDTDGDGVTANEAWASWLVYPYHQLNGTASDGGVYYIDDVAFSDGWNSTTYADPDSTSNGGFAPWF